MENSELKPFPAPIPLKKILGPSFILLALGLGSGEVILWPYLTANYGLGLAWAALLGITFQYFINMEIERYALVKGESVFVGLNQLFNWSAYWFILSTFVGFGLPGIIAASAEVFAFIFGFNQFKWLAIFLLLLIGLILSIGKNVYDLVEKFTKTIIFLGIPFIIILILLLTDWSDWIALLNGLIGFGPNYHFLPAGISLAIFFAAFAYSGAGGNLNLTQSIYIKEKGYGMGKYSQKITGLFHNLGQKKINLSGEKFALTDENTKNFYAWWKKISFEHLLIFWFLGLIAILLLMLLAYNTAFGLANNASGINFVINEGMMIGQRFFPVLGSLFLIVVGVMLFQTQLGILDSASRIIAENIALKKIQHHKTQINLSKIYYLVLWATIIFGVILFFFNVYEPRFLIVLGAVLNAFAMFVHIGLVYWLNQKTLSKDFRPNLMRKIIILIIFCFFGFFSSLIIWDSLIKKLI